MYTRIDADIQYLSDLTMNLEYASRFIHGGQRGRLYRQE